MTRWSSLHGDDELVLAAMWRVRVVQGDWRVVDLAKSSGLPYARAWRACNRLQVWGYIERDGLRRWHALWSRLALNHRLGVVEVAGQSEVAEPEPRWVRILRSVLAHLGGEWV